MVILLSYAIFCVFLARRDAPKIRRDGAVHHNDNLVWHSCWLTVLLFVSFLSHGLAWLPFLKHGLFLPAAMPFIGRVVFDVALNLMRGLKWDYVSPWLLSASPAIRRKVSVLDRIEYRVFKSGSRPKIVYIVIILTLIILHYGT